MVVNSTDNLPVSYAQIRLPYSEDFTDINGKTSFISSIFQRNIKVKRLGFAEERITLPFHFFYLNSTIPIKPSKYQDIESQIEDLFKTVSSYSYAYELSVTDSNSTQTQSIGAKLNGKDFQFKNRSDFTKANYDILYKKNELYIKKDEKYQLLQGEKKNKFTAQNIIFIPANEIINSLFLPDKPEKIILKKDLISILWDNANVNITVDSRGYPESILFSKKTDGNTYKVNFKIKQINKPVNLTK